VIQGQKLETCGKKNMVDCLSNQFVLVEESHSFPSKAKIQRGH